MHRRIRKLMDRIRVRTRRKPRLHYIVHMRDPIPLYETSGAFIRDTHTISANGYNELSIRRGIKRIYPTNSIVKMEVKQ